MTSTLGDTILVTGGAGYIGAHVVLALRDAGRSVVVLDDLSSGDPGSLPADVPLIVADVRDTAMVAHAIEGHHCRAVIHLAALTSLSESFEQAPRYYSVNVGGTRSVANACIEVGASTLLLSSTAAVYAAPQAMEPLHELAPAVPVSPYGASKLMAEQVLAEAISTCDLSGSALRYFNVAGADPHGRAGDRRRNPAHLFGAVAEAAVGTREQVEIFGTDWPTPDGTCIRDYVHVADIAAAHVAVLDALSGDGAGAVDAVMNIAYGQGASVREVVRAAEQVVGRSLPVVPQSRRQGDLPAVTATADRLAAQTDWRPRHRSLEQMMADTVSWASSRLQTPSIGVEGRLR